MPLTFDLPIEQFKNISRQKSVSLRFSIRFGIKSLTEMRAVDPQVEINPGLIFRHPMLSVFICFLRGSELRAFTPNCCDLQILHPHILPYCCSTDIPGILETGSIKLGYARGGVLTVAALDCRGQAGLSEDGGQVFWQHAPWAYYSRTR